MPSISMTKYYIITDRYNNELMFQSWHEAQQHWFTNEHKCAIIYIVDNNHKRILYER